MSETDTTAEPGKQEITITRDFDAPSAPNSGDRHRGDSNLRPFRAERWRTLNPMAVQKG